MSRFLAVVVPVSSLGYRTITNAKLAIFLTWLTPMAAGTPVWWAHNLLSLQTRELRNIYITLKYVHISEVNKR